MRSARARALSMRRQMAGVRMDSFGVIKLKSNGSLRQTSRSLSCRAWCSVNAVLDTSRFRDRPICRTLRTRALSALLGWFPCLRISGRVLHWMASRTVHFCIPLDRNGSQNHRIQATARMESVVYSSLCARRCLTLIVLLHPTPPHHVMLPAHFSQRPLHAICVDVVACDDAALLDLRPPCFQVGKH